jgi:hypothetical protein
MSDKESNSETSSSEPSGKPRKRLDLSAYKERFNNLHKKRVSIDLFSLLIISFKEEGRKLNHDQVVEEDRVLKLPRNHEAKRMRREWELQDMEGRMEAEDKGEDYERHKNLNIQADTAEKIQAAKRRKKRPDTGFASKSNFVGDFYLIHLGYEQMSVRQYERLTNSLKPDMSTYQKMKGVV